MRATKVLFWLAQLLGVAVTIWLLWGTKLPLGVPNEWVWDRIKLTPTGSLQRPVTESETSLTLIRATDFSSQVPYRIEVEDEVMLVTEIDSAAATLTVDRGHDSSPVSPHASGKAVVAPDLVSDAALTELSLGYVITGIATVVFLIFCLFADRRVLEANRWEMTGWLAALVVIGAIWHGVVQECPPEPNRLSKVGWVLWYHGFQGYYEEAKGHASQEPDYLAKYVDRMREGDVFHFGTHPPGFILLHRSILGIVSRSPKLEAWLLEYQPGSVRAGLDVIAENSARSAMPLTDVDRAALWLMGLLTSLAAMSTVVPLFFLVRGSCGREIAWRLVCLWPLIPALAVFHPVSDLWLPFFATSFLAVWARAWAHRSIGAALLAGLVMYLGMMLSLAMLPIAFLAALWTLADCAFGEAIDPFATRAKQLAALVASALGTFAVCVGLTWWMSSLDLPSVWLQNFHNHAGFYDKFPRSYSCWLLINPLELALAAGTPIFLFAVSSWLTSTKGCLRSGRSLASFRLWCFITLAVLWLSGKNSGEVARLWIVLIPWLLWVCGREPEITAKIVNGPGQTLPEYTGTPAHSWLVLMILQAVVCTATVSRIDGFHFKTTAPVGAEPADLSK